MRIKRGENKRRIVVGIAGLALSTVGGVVAGHSAIGAVNPVYKGSGITEHRWSSSRSPAGVSEPHSPAATYASNPTVSGDASAFSAVEPAAKTAAWEQKLDADYVHWQSGVDRELRTQPGDAAPTARAALEPVRQQRPVELAIVSHVVSRVTTAPADWEPPSPADAPSTDTGGADPEPMPIKTTDES